MSVSLRIIPRLDIKGPNLVKGVHLEGLRVLGKPEDFASFYFKEGADELIYQDVVASLYGRNSLHEIISKTAKNIFIPLTVGGGLRTLDDISKVLRAGADKVSINTMAHEDSSFISKAAEMFGKSTIAISIEAIKQTDGSYEAFIDNGRNRTGKNVIDWAKHVESLGAGEILLTSVDREGTGSGFEIELINQIYSSINIPLVVHGGVGSDLDVIKLLKNYSVSGIALSSALHYNFLKKNRNLEGFEKEGNIEFLKSNKVRKNFKLLRLNEIRTALINSGINCRLHEK